MSRRKQSAVLAILLLALAATATVAQQSPPKAAPEDTPATRRVAELVKIINSVDPAATRAYVQNNYAPEFLKIAMDAHLSFIAQFRDRTRGVEFHSMQEATATEATARLRNKLTGDWEALMVRVESDEPHRITSIGMRRPKPPAGEPPSAKLSDAEKARELEAYLQKLADADVF